MSSRSLWKAGGKGRAALLTIITLALVWICTRDALAQAFARARPDFVLKLDPANAIALNLRFRQQLRPTAASTRLLAVWAKRARKSLNRSPLSPAMIRMVATDPAQKRADTLLTLAERVSRRDALTQLALIETAVGAGRVDEALSHYDHALSIYPDLRALLFPVLTGALGVVDIRNGVAKLARRRRPWIEAFLDFAVRETTAPMTLATLLAGIDRGPDALESAGLHQAALASRLAGQGRYLDARRLAMRSAGSGAAAIDAAGFMPATWDRPSRPLTWAVGEGEGVSAELEDERSVFVTIGPGGSELVLYRILVRPPGRYRFAAHAAAPSDGTGTANGRWALVCLREDGRPASNLATVPVDGNHLGSVVQPVVLPVGCAAVRIAFTIDNIDGGADAGLVLRDVSFSPIR